MSNYAVVPQWLYDQIGEKDQRIEELERKVALLEAFVAKFDNRESPYLEVEEARAALDWLPR